MLKYANRRAQSTAEYVIVLGLIVAAVIAMQTYIKRGFQGRIKEAVDGVGGQYEPYYLRSSFSSTHDSGETEELATGGAVSRTTDEVSTREGNQIIGAPEGALEE